MTRSKLMLGALVAFLVLSVGCGAFADGFKAGVEAGQGSDSSSTESSSEETSSSDIDLDEYRAAAKAKETPEYMLASLDAGHPLPADDSSVKSYAEALDSLEEKCGDSRSRLGDMAVRGKQLLEEEGVEESPLSVLRNVRLSMPDSFSQAECADIYGTYVFLRTNG